MARTPTRHTLALDQFLSSSITTSLSSSIDETSTAKVRPTEGNVCRYQCTEDFLTDGKSRVTRSKLRMNDDKSDDILSTLKPSASSDSHLQIIHHQWQSHSVSHGNVSFSHAAVLSYVINVMNVCGAVFRKLKLVITIRNFFSVCDSKGSPVY